MNATNPSAATTPLPTYAIRFPTGEHHEQDAEFCEIHVGGHWKRIRFHDYGAIFGIPGLYEQLFCDLLRCNSPRKVVDLLCRTLLERNGPPTQLSVVDVGAGNGMVGEELRRHGVSRVVGVDIIPEARRAADRDRPDLYDDYIVADLTQLSADDRARLIAHRPNAMITVAALGFGDIPPQAFAAAYNAITTPGWVAFNIRDAFLDPGERSGFARLIRAMGDLRYIQLEASERYIHRLSSDGKKIEYVAMVARKLKDLPSPLPEELLTRPVPARANTLAASRPMISMRNVSKSHDGGRTTVVQDLALDVHPGELLAIVGGSGAGKTTALKMINRLIEPTGGMIELDGVDAQELDPVKLRRDIGYVFQGIGLFPHMTVAENVATVPRLLGWGGAEIARRVDELLELVGLPAAQFRLRRPRELSGGQQQRVGFARALAARPKLLLLDEPFGALDPITRDTLQREFATLHRQLRLTSVMVTHDMSEALLLADRIAVMRGGRLLQIGSPRELLADPHDPYVARLLETPRDQANRLEELMNPSRKEDE